MNIQILLHPKQTLAICLLIALMISGCSSPTKTPVVLNPLAPVETKSPCINITVSNTTPKLGEVITVTGTVINVVKPNYYGLEIKDQDADSSSILINLLANTPKTADVSNIVEMASADYSDGTAVIGLKAVSTGMIKINYFVSAEDFCGVPLGNGISPRIEITVSP